jgi:hypothetical protein
VTAHSYSKRWFYDACIVALEDGDCSVALHPGLSRSARSEVCERAKELIEHFRNEGPAGAWQPRSDGGYQVWLTQRYFSDDGVEEVPPSARLVADDELWRSPSNAAHGPAARAVSFAVDLRDVSARSSYRDPRIVTATRSFRSGPNERRGCSSRLSGRRGTCSHRQHATRT